MRKILDAVVIRYAKSLDTQYHDVDWLWRAVQKDRKDTDDMISHLVRILCLECATRGRSADDIVTDLGLDGMSAVELRRTWFEVKVEREQ
jgi:hypothetical protein